MQYIYLTLTPGTKQNSASVNSLYLLEKLGHKTNRSDVFWD